MKTHLAVVLQGEIKGKSDNALSLGTTRDFQTLDNPGDTLVLKTRVLSFSVLANDSKVDARVTRGETRKGLAKDYRRINI